MIGQHKHFSQIERSNRKILPVIQLNLDIHVVGRKIKAVEYCESDSLSPPNGERIPRRSSRIEPMKPKAHATGFARRTTA
jgi:hypothetical protein